MKEMTPYIFEDISDEAEKRYSEWYRKNGVRGQLINARDGPEYWYALVAWEMVQKLKDEEIKSS